MSEEDKSPLRPFSEHLARLAERKASVEATEKLLRTAQRVSVALRELGVPEWASVPHDGGPGWGDAGWVHGHWPHAHWGFDRKNYQGRNYKLISSFRVELDVGGHADTKPYERYENMSAVRWHYRRITPPKWGWQELDVTDFKGVARAELLDFPEELRRTIVEDIRVCEPGHNLTHYDPARKKK